MTATMTMNFPAQYTVVAENEMVYLTGGSLLTETDWKGMASSMGTAVNWTEVASHPFNAVKGLFTALRYAAAIETDGFDITSFGNLLNGLGDLVRYTGKTMIVWDSLIF